MPRFTISHFRIADDRGRNFDVSLRARSFAHQLLKDSVILRPAIRIAGTILRNGPNEYRRGPNDLRPAYRNRKEMSVTKWDVSGRNFVPANRSACFALLARQCGHPSAPNHQFARSGPVAPPGAPARRKNRQFRQRPAARGAPCAGRNWHEPGPNRAFRRAIAAVTQESIPPLSKTTALGLRLISDQHFLCII